MMEFALALDIENSVGNGENTGYKNFLILSNYFKTVSFGGRNGLNIYFCQFEQTFDTFERLGLKPFTRQQNLDMFKLIA